MEEDYKIVVSLSHNRISYDYWQREGENKLFPFPGGPWPAPLSFYVSPTGVMVGHEGHRAVNTANRNAFTKYFETLTHGTSYQIGTQIREFRNLLLDASENMFRDFFKSVLYDSKGNLSDNRASMPLILVYESDVSSSEKALVNSLFINSGYQSLNFKDYNDFIGEYLAKRFQEKYNCRKVLVAWSEGEDLSYTLFDAMNSAIIANKTYKGMGVDPRVRIVEKLIWDSVTGQNPWLRYDTEAHIIHKAALKFLNSSAPLINERIKLSDGQTYSYSFNRVMVDSMPHAEGRDLRESLHEFLKENSVSTQDKVLLLLRGTAADNTYFENNLRYGFQTVVKSDRNLRDSVMKMVVDSYRRPKIPYTPSPAPPQRRPKEEDIAKQDSRPSADKFPGTNAADPKKTDVDITLALPEEKNEKKELTSEEKRKIRQLLFDSKQQANKGNKEEASDLLQRAKELIGDAVDQLPESTQKILQEAQSIVSSISSDVEKLFKNVSEKIKNINLGFSDKLKIGKDKVVPPPIKPSDRKSQSNSIPPRAKQLMDKREFIMAKDIFREQGNHDMASLCSDLNKAHRQYKILVSQYSGYVRTRNIVGAQKATEEIARYIELLKKAGLSTSEEIRMLNSYQSIR